MRMKFVYAMDYYMKYMLVVMLEIVFELVEGRRDVELYSSATRDGLADKGSTK
jgi:hypothetical protein